MQGFRLQIHDRHTFVRLACGVFADERSTLRLSGGQRGRRFPPDLLPDGQTLDDVDSVTMQLSPPLVPRVLRLAMPAGHLPRAVYHVVIERAGEHCFEAYDNFAENCVWVSSEFPETLLRTLVLVGIVRGYTPFPNDQEVG